MPLLQQILQELDRELTRLHQLRTLVAGLSRTPTVVRRLTEPASTPAAATHKPERPAPARKARRDVGQKRGPRPRKVSEPETRAVNSAVPLGPVVFYPGRQPAPEPAVEVSAPARASAERTAGDLDAESRALAARWAAPATP